MECIPIDNFLIQEIVGEGTFGKVSLGIKTAAKTRV